MRSSKFQKFVLTGVLLVCGVSEWEWMPKHNSVESVSSNRV